MAAALEHEFAPSAQSGDAPALLIGRLYEEHYRMIRALCQLLLRDSVEAEDAAQQTFLSAFGSMLGGTVPQLPAPWLATIARRECWSRSAQRRRRPLALDETNSPACPFGDALEEAVRKADLSALWTAINALPRQQRAAFLMREFSGLSYAQVAEALGASESAIESLLVRARRQLRDGLEVTRIANVASAVFVLRHRLVKLLSWQAGVESASAGSAGPVAVRVGAAVAAAVVLAGTVHEGAVRLSHHAHAASPAAAPDVSPAPPLLNDPLVFASATFGSRTFWADAAAADRQGVPATIDPFAAPADSGSAVFPGAATASGGAGAAGADSAPAGGGTDAAPTDTSSPADSAAPPGGVGEGSAPATSADAIATPTDAPPTDTSPTDTTPADTSPVDTAPADTTPVPDEPAPDDTSG